MPKWALVMSLVGFCGVAVSCVAHSTSQVTHYEAPGNLESLNPIRCGQPVTPMHTPADLYPAVSQCVRAGRLDDALLLYAFGHSYGVLDSKRVSDISAHQAIPALGFSNLGSLPSEQAEAFSKHLKSSFEPEAPGLGHICSELRRVGPPEYEPRYMIQHGMGPFLGEPNVVPGDFDLQEAWSAVLLEQMHCG
jgi:hypothetical protein